MLRIAARSFPAVLFAALWALPATAQFQTQYGGAMVQSVDQLLVGDASDDASPGVVHVYGREGADWRLQGTLRAPDAAANDGFGSALALDGELLLVGAPAQEERRGAVYLFRRAGANWEPAGRLVAGAVEPGDGFGLTVALHGDYLFVGAPLQATRTGAVYVFRRSGSTWSEVATLKGTVQDGFFGSRIALAGERALVGAFGEDNATGAVYPYRLVNGAWQPGEKLVADPAPPRIGFGIALHLTPQRALIGAPRAAGGAGVVYAFTPSDAGWTPAGRIPAPDTTAQEVFGAAIAAAGAEVFVGAPLADGRRGAVYVLRESDGTWTVAERIASPLERAAQFGGITPGTVIAVSLPAADFGLGRVALVERQGGTSRVVQQLEGELAHTLPALTGGERRCSDTDSVAVFGCKDVDLLAFLPVKDIGGARGVRLNDVWGWTDPQGGKEYALVGRMDGTSFIDVSDATNPVYLGDLPLTAGANPNTWRDMKVYRDHVYIVADGAGQHGMQVFDLTLLRAVQPGAPQQFTAAVTYDRIASAHNIVINEESGFAYIVGASGGESCGGGLHMVDIREPMNPQFAGCFSDPQTGRAATGYTHDAQCVIYRGPDADYRGREICLGANETALSIADVTDKANPKALARASYPNVGYSHQGWLTEDQRYFFMDDELDELNGTVPRTRTLIWDLADLDDPQLAGEFLGTTEASDHNLYIRGDTMYQSNYQAGLRVVDISVVTAPVEIGYFDTVPHGTNTPGFGGSWSNYPYFRSGTIVVTSGSEGVFLLKKRPARPVS